MDEETIHGKEYSKLRFLADMAVLKTSSSERKWYEAAERRCKLMNEIIADSDNKVVMITEKASSHDDYRDSYGILKRQEKHLRLETIIADGFDGDIYFQPARIFSFPKKPEETAFTYVGNVIVTSPFGVGDITDVAALPIPPEVWFQNVSTLLGKNPKHRQAYMLGNRHSSKKLREGLRTLFL